MAHKLHCPEDIRTCDDAIRFGEQQGWGKRNGGRHVVIFNPKGSYAVPHGNHKELSPGVRHAIIKMARYMLILLVAWGIFQILALILSGKWA